MTSALHGRIGKVVATFNLSVGTPRGAMHGSVLDATFTVGPDCDHEGGEAGGRGVRPSKPSLPGPAASPARAPVAQRIERTPAKSRIRVRIPAGARSFPVPHKVQHQLAHRLGRHADTYVKHIFIVGDRDDEARQHVARCG